MNLKKIIRKQKTISNYVNKAKARKVQYLRPRDPSWVEGSAIGPTAIEWLQKRKSAVTSEARREQHETAKEESQ